MITATPYGLTCEECPRSRKCDEWPAEGTGYKFEGHRIAQVDWEACPASYLRSPHLNYAMDLYAAAQVSPIADWPDGWAAWVREWMVAIDYTIRDRKRIEAARHG